MKKEEFCNAVRNKLREIPLETRRKWKDIDLMSWWQKVKAKDSYLTWERAHGDIWQHVKGMCKDLIGSKAI